MTTGGHTLPPKTPTYQAVMHLETFPKIARRAVKQAGGELSTVEVRASVPADGEHGKTTITYTHALDETQHGIVQNAIVKAAAREHAAFLADDEEDA